MTWNATFVLRDQRMQIETRTDYPFTGTVGFDENGRPAIDGQPVSIGDVGDGWRIMPLGTVKEKRRRGGRPVAPHPAMTAQARVTRIARGSREQRRKQKKIEWKQRDATDDTVQTMNRLIRQYVQEAPDGDGLVSGPLRFAAEHLASELQAAHDLGGEDHRVAIAQWLYGNWGLLADSFPDGLAAQSYLEWREDCARRAREAACATT